MVKRAILESVLGSWRVYSLLVPPPCANSLSFWKVRFCFKSWKFYAWCRVMGQITLLRWGEFSSELSALRFKHQRSPRRPHSNQADFIFSYFPAERGESSAKLWGPGPSYHHALFRVDRALIAWGNISSTEQHKQVPPMSMLRDWNYMSPFLLSSAPIWRHCRGGLICVEGWFAPSFPGLE